MDYIFRWLQIRFLSGQQLTLFSGLAPQVSVPVEGHIGSLNASVTPEGVIHPFSASTDSGVIPSAARNPRISSEAPGLLEETYTTTPPKQGIAPDPTYTAASSPLTMEDRGIYHAADAMKSMYDMGDAPSCATCGAIMTRNGSCYRCMECGSTSGCS